MLDVDVRPLQPTQLPRVANQDIESGPRPRRRPESPRSPALFFSLKSTPEKLAGHVATETNPQGKMSQSEDRHDAVMRSES